MAKLTDADLNRRVQIATTAHFTLTTEKTATIAEATGRAAMFLTAASMSMVALGFVAGATKMQGPFLLLAAVLLTSLLAIGVVTFLRVVQNGAEDVELQARIERVERQYETLAPGSVVWRVAPTDGPPPPVVASQDQAPPPWPQIFLTAASMIGLVDGVLAGALGALGAVQAGLNAVPSTAVGAVVFAVAGLALIKIQRGMWRAHWRRAATWPSFTEARDPLSS